MTDILLSYVFELSQDEKWKKQWVDWWSSLLQDIVYLPFNREGGLPEYDLIKDRAVIWKLYDHALDGQKLAKLSGHTIMSSIISDVFEASGPIQESSVLV